MHVKVEVTVNMMEFAYAVKVADAVQLRLVRRYWH